ncbi:MAG: hypothetical protein ACYS8Z_12125 [Planctomycetota bacterium]
MIFVGVASLTLIVGAYMLYSRSNKTPQIKIGSGADIGDINLAGDGSVGGRIGPATINVLEGTVYSDRDANGKIVREFGFAEIVRTIGDVWEVGRPWMTVYQREYKFDIRADQGTTELQDLHGSTMPKYATFKGNVTIRIILLDETEQVQGTVHLDSLVFQSEKSRFSTPGYIKLLSQNVDMYGKDLEFVYNERTQRLDYVRLTCLDDLQIRGTAEALFGELDSSPQDGSETAPEVSASEPGVAVSDKSVEAGEGRGKATSPAVVDTADAEGEFYKFIFSEKVLIETPDEIVLAREEVSINDIFWSKALMDEDPNSPGDANAPEAPETAKSQVAAGRAKEKLPVDPNAPAGEIIEITVKSSNGLLLIPVNSRKSLASFERAETDKAEYDSAVRAVFADANERSTFVTDRIDYNSVSGDVTTGPGELVFHTGSITELDPNETSVPVTVSATESVRFFKAANQAVFIGEPLMKMPQTELSQPRDATFTGSKFIVNLPEDAPDGSKIPGDIVAEGPVEFIYHFEDANSADANEPPVPVSITAFEQARFLPDSNQVVFDVNCVITMPRPGLPPEQNFTFTSPRLIANLPKKGVRKDPDVIAPGPIKLKAYVPAFDSNEPNAAPLPATVTANKHARFLPSENQTFFEGNCRAVVVREDPNFVEQYILSSQKMTVVLPEDSNRPESKSVSDMGIEHFTASGGVVRLGTKKMVGEKQISGIDIECSEFDYDPNAERFTVEGPGDILLTNTEPLEQGDPNETAERFSLKKPCWAKIENYDKLTYFEKEKRIVAEAQSEGSLVVQYLPIEEDGRLGDVVLVTANRVEAILIETPLGDTELATLTASGGITYQAKDNYFSGGQLFYDHETQRVKVIGSDSFPCLLNGALADEILYDLEADIVDANLVGPGALQLK